MDGESYCVILPGYCEEGRIGLVVKKTLKHCDSVIVIDDGSPDKTAEEAKNAGAFVIRHSINMGKGRALKTGCEYAVSNNHDFLITLDADGQHDPDEIPAFVKEYRNSGCPVLIGNRMGQAEVMPFVRRITNRFMSWLLSRRIGQRIPDTQCGYRLYAKRVFPHYLRFKSDGYAAESEVLLLLASTGIKIGSVPIKAIYGDEKSKIRPLRDALKFFAMLRKYKTDL